MYNNYIRIVYKILTILPFLNMICPITTISKDHPIPDTPGMILVTGTTGYIGGRPVPSLFEKGYHVRCLARDPSRLQGRSCYEQVEVVKGDVLSPEKLIPAMTGVDIAYYLVHSMASGAVFREQDLVAARNFASAARRAGVQHIIYLGGLGDPQSALSPHLGSRQQTGEALRENDAPAVILLDASGHAQPRRHRPAAHRRPA
jgi:uncharacterized protein YbjT (DUF2867 family)